MKKRKRISNTYTPWEMDKGCEKLNRLSGEGWQLERVGAFVITLVRDESKVYRYQADYCKNADGRYYETFREQGWEEVCNNSMDYHWFRKEYDSTLPDSEYEIYTDDESYEKAIKATSKTYWWLLAAYLPLSISYVMAYLSDPNPISFIVMAGYLLLAVTYLFSVIAIYRKAKDRTRKIFVSGKAITVMLCMMLVMLFAVPFLGVLNNKRTELETNMTWELCSAEGTAEDEVVHELDFDVRKAGTHSLRLVYSCEEAPISVEIVDAEGNVVYRAEPSLQCSIKGEKLELEEGGYAANVYVENGSSNADFSISIVRDGLGIID